MNKFGTVIEWFIFSESSRTCPLCFIYDVLRLFDPPFLFSGFFQFVTVIAHAPGGWGATQEDIVVFLKQHGIHARVGTTTPEHLGQRVEIFGKHGDFCKVNDKHLTWFQCHMEYNETNPSLKILLIFDTPKIMVFLQDLQGLVNIQISPKERWNPFHPPCGTVVHCEGILLWMGINQISTCFAKAGRVWLLRHTRPRFRGGADVKIWRSRLGCWWRNSEVWEVSFVSSNFCLMFIIRFWTFSCQGLILWVRVGMLWSWIFMSVHECLRILILNTDPNVKLHGLQLYIVKGPKTDRKFEFITGWTSSYWSDLFFSWDHSDTKSSKRRHQQCFHLGTFATYVVEGVRTPQIFRLHIGSWPWAMGQSSSGELQKELLYAEDSDGSSHGVG